VTTAEDYQLPETPGAPKSQRPRRAVAAVLILGFVLAGWVVWQLAAIDGDRRLPGADHGDREVVSSPGDRDSAGPFHGASVTDVVPEAPVDPDGPSVDEGALVDLGVGPDAATDLVSDAFVIIDGVIERLLALQDGDGGWRTDDLRWGRRGATALALLFFLGNGQLPDESRTGTAMQRGLSFLQGEASDGEHPYADAAVAMALSEIAAMTGAAADSPLLAAATDASTGLEATALPGGGWSVAPGSPADVGATGLAIMALTSRRLLTGDDGGEALQRARGWATGLDPTAIALGADETLSNERAAMAVAVLSRVFLHVGDPRGESMELAAELLVAAPPAPTDHLTAYLASMALYQVGGAPWQGWRDHLGTRFDQGTPADPAEAALLGLSACIASRFPVPPSPR